MYKDARELDKEHQSWENENTGDLTQYSIGRWMFGISLNKSVQKEKERPKDPSNFLPTPILQYSWPKFVWNCSISNSIFGWNSENSLHFRAHKGVDVGSQGVQNLPEIALALNVWDKQHFWFLQKFKMAAKLLTILRFLKRVVLSTQGVQIFPEIALFLTVFEITFSD